MLDDLLAFGCYGVAALFVAWLVLVVLACCFCRIAGGDPLPPPDLSAIRPGTPVGRHLYADRSDVSADEAAEAGYPEARQSLHD